MRLATDWMVDVDSRYLIATQIDLARSALGMPADIASDPAPSASLDFGDFSSPVALRLAGQLRRSPVSIAEELVSWLNAHPVSAVALWSATPPGYVNARMSDEWTVGLIAETVSLSLAVPLRLDSEDAPSGKILVEHTNINTNKAAHVGHLRNACIGDAVARILRRRGETVEVNNYIDDTGVQVADVVIGIYDLGIAQEEGELFDQYCSRVYVEVSALYEREPALVERRKALLRRIEEREASAAEMVRKVAVRIVEAHLATMARVGIGYDLLTWESDILEKGFWKLAFSRLLEKGLIVKCESGPHAGCWVLPSEDGDSDSPDAKVLVKSDGVATYTAKDIAYQLWKFGLLGADFDYAQWDARPGSPATTTSDIAARRLEGVSFGHATTVVNVIDARQSYPQAVVKAALERLGYPKEASRSFHLAYEVVALSQSAAEALGIALSDGKSVYALSGRKGIEVRADELLDTVRRRVAEKAHDSSTADVLAAAAVRHYLQKFSLNTVIPFDFDEALRTSGDSGVYLEYAHARAWGILRRVPEDKSPVGLPGTLTAYDRKLVLLLDSYRYVLRDASIALSPAILAAYGLELASGLSDFYEHTPPILHEKDEPTRNFRRALVASTATLLSDLLTTMGMVPLKQI